MKNIKNESELNKELTENYQKNQEDSTNATLGVIIGGIFLILGFIILFINPQMGLIMIALSIFPLCEVFRSIISLRIRKMSYDSAYTQSEEQKEKVIDYSKKLKIISKIKIIDFIIIILMIITLLIINF